MIDLSIIVVTFNTKELVINLLESLKIAIKECKNFGYKIETLIVDNHSTDGTCEYLQKKYQWITIIKNKKNLGYSCANNIGILKAKGELMLLLNSDTQVFRDTLVKMITFMKNYPQAGAATCRVQLSSGKMDSACHRGFPTPWNAFCYFSGLEKIYPRSKIFAGYHQDWKKLETIHEIDACSGAFFLIRHVVIDKIGLLDENFFMYGEDLDWAYRIKAAGFRIFFNPETKIIHFKKSSGRQKLFNKKENSDLIDIIKKQSKQNFYETMKLFYEKHYQKKYPSFMRKIVYGGIWLVSKFKN